MEILEARSYPMELQARVCQHLATGEVQQNLDQ